MEKISCFNELISRNEQVPSSSFGPYSFTHDGFQIYEMEEESFFLDCDLNPTLNAGVQKFGQLRLNNLSENAYSVRKKQSFRTDAYIRIDFFSVRLHRY